ncbi:MAG TPA: DeoR/GlpR transcriptional regulator, partial [Paenirhodobacter sp.]
TVAATLSTNPSIQVILAPGTYDPGEAAMVGAFATEFLGRLHADVALTGASGIGADGPSETQIDMAAIYTTMTRQCGRSIVLADQSKFGKIFSVCYVPWSHVDTLVADASPTPPLLDSLQAARVRLIQAH